MKKLTVFISVVFLLLVQGISGQNIRFLASAKNVVRTGERFNLTYTLNAEGKGFRVPDMEKFRVLSGPGTSTSSSIQIINGQVTKSVEYTYTYILSALDEEGIFEIPPATVTIDGKTIESNPVKIQVVKGGSTQQQGQQGSSGSQSSNSDSEDFSDDVFISAVVNKTNPYQGEQVLVTYKLYYRISISSPEFKKEPSFKGFWVTDLIKDKGNFEQYQETYNGQRYHVAELKKLALFPQQSGRLTIEAIDAVCQAQVKSQSQQRTNDPFFDNFFNDPFFNRYKTIEIPINCNSVNIQVKPLPGGNQPADFSGAVGEFDFSSSLDKTELKTNEAINLKLSVSGSGNIELIDKINVAFPPDFEVYDPKITQNINTGSNGVSGRKTFEYLIIPRTPGKFRINSVKFTFFDLSRQQYVSLTSPEYEINVAKGEGTETGVSYSGIDKSDIKYIGSDIRHIRTGNPNLKPAGVFFFASGKFYMLLFIPVVLFILFLIIWKKELEKRSNIALMRNRKATKVARKRMKNAQLFLKENKKDEFYVEVSQALWGYLSDKFSIPLSHLSIDTVNETLQNKQVKEETINRFIQTLNNCEFARFAPGDSTTAMENIYNESVSIISIMENELR